MQFNSSLFSRFSCVCCFLLLQFGQFVGGILGPGCRAQTIGELIVQNLENPADGVGKVNSSKSYLHVLARVGNTPLLFFQGGSDTSERKIGNSDYFSGCERNNWGTADALYRWALEEDNIQFPDWRIRSGWGSEGSGEAELDCGPVEHAERKTNNREVITKRSEVFVFIPQREEGKILPAHLQQREIVNPSELVIGGFERSVNGLSIVNSGQNDLYLLVRLSGIGINNDVSRRNNPSVARDNESRAKAALRFDRNHGR